MRDQAPRGSGRTDQARTFSAREVEVLQAVADHGTAVAAAEALGCMPRTVEVHLGNIRRKLGLPTTLQCVVHGYREGLLH